MGLFAVMLVVPLPKGERPFEALTDSLHAPGFAVLTAVLLGLLRSRTRWSLPVAALAVWTFAVGFGATMEYLQGIVGRSPSVQDLVANTLGATAGVIWTIGRTAGRWRRVASWCAAVALLVVAAWYPLLNLVDSFLQRREMPQIASFEHSLEMIRWDWNDARVRRVACRNWHGNWALRVDLEPGKYPGVALLCPVPDWSHCDTLSFDVELDAGEPLDLTVKVQDRKHSGHPDDRFDRTFRLTPGRHHLRIPLADVAAAPQRRRMDLDRIDMLQFFTVDLDTPRTLHLDNIRLQ